MQPMAYQIPHDAEPATEPGDAVCHPVQGIGHLPGALNRFVSPNRRGVLFVT